MVLLPETPGGFSHIAIESLIPHRDGMRLIDALIAAGPDTATTTATAAADWPLVRHGAVEPIVLIELVAQTSAAAIGWRKLQESEEAAGGTGLLVGIKSATFQIDGIPVGGQIITEATIQFNMDHFTEIRGVSTLDGQVIGTVTLQVIRTDEEADNG